MIRKLLFLFLFLSTPAWATQYYVSTTGSDSANGAIGTPFLTVQKCANTVAAGDTCNINNGTYRETVTPPTSGTNGSPITFTCVNSGQCIISGSNLATGWSLSSGSIYNSNVGNISGLNQVYVDGVFIDQARYPQNTLLTTTSAGTCVSGTSTTISTAIATGGSNVLTSAQVVNATVFSRVNEWTWDSSTAATAFTVATGTISSTSISNQCMYFNSTGTPSGWGFYLSAANGSALTWMQTYAGSWYYDNSNVLSLWTPASDNPGNHTVEVAARTYGFNISSKNYITIQNMIVEYALNSDIRYSSANNIILNNVKTIGGQRGVYVQTGSNDLVENSTFTNPLFAGVSGNTTTNLTVTNNTFSGAGNVGSPKVGQSEGGAMYITTSNSGLVVTKNNTNLDGYAGIVFNASSYTISRNTITNSCQVLDDCAAIYTDNNQTQQPTWHGIIDNNTIINTASNTYIGTSSTRSDSQGIYLDDLSSGYTIINNYIQNVDYGIFLHSAYNNIIMGNTVKAARSYGLQLSESGSLSGEVAGVMVNNIITHNEFESLSNFGLTNFGGGVAAYWSSFLTTDILNFGTFDYNQYCNPNNGGTAVSTQGQPPDYGNTNYTLSEWQSYSSQDAHSNYVNSLCSTGTNVTLTGTVTLTGQIAVN